jgi:hypothetical protein
MDSGNVALEIRRGVSDCTRLNSLRWVKIGQLKPALFEHEVIHE